MQQQKFEQERYALVAGLYSKMGGETGEKAAKGSTFVLAPLRGGFLGVDSTGI